jgi:hypothetical protein
MQDVVQSGSAMKPVISGLVMAREAVVVMDNGMSWRGDLSRRLARIDDLGWLSAM